MQLLALSILSVFSVTYMENIKVHLIIIKFIRPIQQPMGDRMSVDNINILKGLKRPY